MDTGKGEIALGRGICQVRRGKGEGWGGVSETKLGVQADGLKTENVVPPSRTGASSRERTQKNPEVDIEEP